MRIAKRFKGHAAEQIAALLRHYKPPSRVEVIARFYDPADDGPEVDIIRFFRNHPAGKRGGRARCLHTREKICVLP